MSTSMGALATLSAFLTANKRSLSVMSASSPVANVAVDRERPMMVRYCMCQPYEALLSTRSVQGVDGRMWAEAGAHGVRVEDEVLEGVGEGGEAHGLDEVSVLDDTRKQVGWGWVAHVEDRAGAPGGGIEAL